MKKIRTLDEIRDNIASTVRDTQIEVLLTNFLNLKLAEIWNFHPWTFARRKATFSTVASQEDYALDEEVDRIMLVRQRTSPHKLLYLPDHIFYKHEPNPEGGSTGNPLYYRLWEETGFSTALAADDTIYVKSSSSSDGSSFKVVVVGRDTDGTIISEEFTLNGTTAVTSQNTYDAGGLMQVSKSGRTTGTITVYRTTGDTVLARIGPEERAPRYKKISLYPIPSSAITMYVEYCERLRLLVNDADVPQIDSKWTWVLREGALALTWAYKQNETASALAQRNFEQGLKLMRKQDESFQDYIPTLAPYTPWSLRTVSKHRDSVSSDEPAYSLAF